MFYNQTFICICPRCKQPKYQITTCTESYTKCNCPTYSDYSVLFNKISNSHTRILLSL